MEQQKLHEMKNITRHLINNFDKSVTNFEKNTTKEKMQKLVNKKKYSENLFQKTQSISAN